MRYTKENIDGVIFTYGGNKYKMVYPSATNIKKERCDIFHYKDNKLREWGTIIEFNEYVENELFHVLETPQESELYPIY